MTRLLDAHRPSQSSSGPARTRRRVATPSKRRRGNARSWRFRQGMAKRWGSFVGGKRYVEHHLSRLVRRPARDQLPPLVVVDVLSREGRIVRKLLEQLLETVRERDDSPFECIVARIVVQARDGELREELERVASDTELMAELEARQMFGWFREIPNIPQRIRHGTVYGNWIATHPYPVEDAKCAALRERLWRGDELDELDVHDFYFGFHGSDDTDEDIYNYIPLDVGGVSLAMRETAKQIASLHKSFWRQTTPARGNPGTFEFISSLPPTTGIVRHTPSAPATPVTRLES